MKLRPAILRLGQATALAALLLAATPAFAAAPAVEAASGRALAAGVPADTVEAIVARGTARGLDANALTAALASVEKAAARGLPVAGIADKVLEGIAKGIPPARLLPVVDGMVFRLAEADTALARVHVSLDGRPELVEAGAEALRRGAGRDALVALAAEVGNAPVPAEQLGLAIRELGDLAAVRAATPTAGLALGRMVARGYAAGAIAEISDRVAAGTSEGAAPADLLEEIAVRAHSGRPMDHLVDPFAERPGAVNRDREAHRRLEQLPDAAKGKGLNGHPLGGPPGQSGLDRPGLPTAPGQLKKLEKDKQRGQPGTMPGGQGPVRPEASGK
ncbi:hypothetical protein [Vulgatibacter sp.]|uniref:hypothetical protein n=1 Tax=Vulgatibacter sp. TaxID=1971226 RepID=UPI0035683730